MLERAPLSGAAQSYWDQGLLVGGCWGMGRVRSAIRRDGGSRSALGLLLILSVARGASKREDGKEAGACYGGMREVRADEGIDVLHGSRERTKSRINLSNPRVSHSP